MFGDSPRRDAAIELLFLDIDGVLHADPCETQDAFCRQAELWRLLDMLPDTYVVISSTWRERHTLADLTALILREGGEHLSQRFIGVTPQHPELKNIYGGREKEILAWLSENAAPGAAWLAIDDTASGFSDYGRNPHLYLTDHRVGLTHEDVDQIIAHISRGADDQREG